MQTPRFCGQLCNAGAVALRFLALRRLRISWLIVGMSLPFCLRSYSLSCACVEHANPLGRRLYRAPVPFISLAPLRVRVMDVASQAAVMDAEVQGKASVQMTSQISSEAQVVAD